MPEYVSNPIQTVNEGQNVLFTETPVPCKSGYVIHREGAGIITLRGIVNNPTSCYAQYKVSFGGNISIPTGGTIEPISVAIAIGGEPIPTSSAIVSPTTVDSYFNVYESIFINVPKGCCYTIAVENTSTQSINIQNANILIERTA